VAQLALGLSDLLEVALGLFSEPLTLGAGCFELPAAASTASVQRIVLGSITMRSLRFDRLP
jgi:hypothetical protein